MRLARHTPDCSPPAVQTHITEQSGETRYGLLHSEGQVRTRVGMRAHMNNWSQQGRLTDRFGECLFRICPMLKYEASSTILAQRTRKTAKVRTRVGDD